MMYYSIKDALSSTFMPTFTAENDNVAKRLFSVTVNDKSNAIINQNPQDYQLYRIAEWDKTTGEIKANKVLVADATSVIKEA